MPRVCYSLGQYSVNELCIFGVRRIETWRLFSGRGAAAGAATTGGVVAVAGAVAGVVATAGAATATAGDAAAVAGAGVVAATATATAGTAGGASCWYWFDYIFPTPTLVEEHEDAEHKWNNIAIQEFQTAPLS